MGLLGWFDAKAARECGASLAKLILKDLPVDNSIKEKKFAIKAEKTLRKVVRELDAFKRKNSLNTYKKAKLGNAFLWTLKESGVNDKYANDLTEWLTVRL